MGFITTPAWAQQTVCPVINSNSNLTLGPLGSTSVSMHHLRIYSHYNL